MTAVALPEPVLTDPTTTDPDVTLAASGDRRAFERLYHAHVNRVFSLCAKLHLFRGESAFGTWLHRLTVNVVLNDRKTEGRQRSRFEDDEEGDGVEGLAARPVSPGDRMDLEKAIAALPKGARRVFTLHDVEGYKHEEIAEMLGVTSGATKAQLHRARMLLREALTR